jgi:hypothetical protein
MVDEVIICDFGSEPAISASIADLSPKIILVTCGRGEPWNKGLAQNIGVSVAQCDVILKLDCDIFCNNLQKYIDAVRRGLFVSGYIPFIDGKLDFRKQGCFGQVMFRQKDWLSIGGYHEFMHGWGFDDQDLYNRLEDSGVEHRFFDLDDLADIEHGDDVRGGARIVDDFGLSVPDLLRTDKGFQNTRNKLLAGIVPWSPVLMRKSMVRAISPSHLECVLEPRSKLEMRTQLTAAFLASRFVFSSHAVEEELRRALIDERMADFAARARGCGVT